MEYLDLTIVSM